ncbi:hypothetical protein RZS08_17985, partial [Arthrospira platensis SPKY1]|nr:hypothetical protein [Arthrospira platensis SPKY1]
MAAAAGPALLIIGKLATGVLALNTPLGLAAAAFSGIALYVVRNWPEVQKTIIDTANDMIKLYNESTGVRAAFESIAAVGGIAFDTLSESLDSFMVKMTSSGKAIWAFMTGDWKTAFDEGTTYLAAMAKTMGVV